jgi:hypothetical protein
MKPAQDCDIDFGSMATNLSEIIHNVWSDIAVNWTYIRLIHFPKMKSNQSFLLICKLLYSIISILLRR